MAHNVTIHDDGTREVEGREALNGLAGGRSRGAERRNHALNPRGMGRSEADRRRIKAT